MAYGDKRDYPKIDIFARREDGTKLYLATTTWAATCKEAVKKYAERSADYEAGDLIAKFQ